MKYPFEVDYKAIVKNPAPYVTAVFSSLVSDFITMPKGPGFVEYSVFESGYEAIKKASSGFSIFQPDKLIPIAYSEPISLVVLRSILGFTPPEWAYIATNATKIEVTQGYARSLDRKIRMTPDTPLKEKGVAVDRIKALVEVACKLINEGPSDIPHEFIHRLEKADTSDGLSSVKNLSDMGVPFPVLLYERFLGRPFAGHRDSVSDLIGDSLEIAIEDKLHKAGISFRKLRRAEKVKGFDQTPDFIIPDEFNPQIVIEAKITEDDGTARDKVTRIQHLGELSLKGTTSSKPNFEVIACIGGRGFGVRKADMQKMLLATRGKVFTLKTIDKMIKHTRLIDFVSR